MQPIDASARQHATINFAAAGTDEPVSFQVQTSLRATSGSTPSVPLGVRITAPSSSHGKAFGIETALLKPSGAKLSGRATARVCFVSGSGNSVMSAVGRFDTVTACGLSNVLDIEVVY